MKNLIFYCFLFVLLSNHGYAQRVQLLIDKGWSELVKDNDTNALKYFSEAFDLAQKNNDTKGKAEALLKIGITSYGSSMSNGMHYANRALLEFEKLNFKEAQIGRSKCLVLIGTIKAREKKYYEAISLGNEAIQNFIVQKDTSSGLGLAYGLLGSVYSHLNKIDSSDYYFTLSHEERVGKKDITYLPNSFTKMGNIELRNNNKSKSWNYYTQSLDLATSSSNRQAQIGAILGMAKWKHVFENNIVEANYLLMNAKKLAETISDKTYLINVLEQLKNNNKIEGKYSEALGLEEQIVELKEYVSNSEKDHLTKSLEVQFGLSEKERELKLVKKEKEVTTLTNYLLFGIIAFGSITAISFIYFLKRIIKRDKQLIETKEALIRIETEQKKLKEQQLQNEIEFKESQLSALTIQMMQKNDLMQELKDKLESNANIRLDSSVSKIISKGLNQDKEWTDFNTHFESINKNFYSRIKQAFPEISPNEMKICALIKMNLSSKEMASILNISPDSVKTARYRLRKKLNLNTEDNLTDFILHLQ